MLAQVRPMLLGTVALAWFLTLVGGWHDVGAALADAAPFQTKRTEADRATGPPGGAAVRLEGRVLAADDRFGLPTHVTVAGDELLLVDRHGGHALLALDRRTGAVRRGFGREGAGPGEFRAPMAAVATDSLVGVLDAGLNRITWLASSGDPPEFELAAIVGLAIESAALDFALTDDGDYLLTGFMTSGRLARVAADTFAGYVGQPPDVQGLPPARRAEVYQGTIRSSPSRERQVVTNRFASRIEVWSGSRAGPRYIWGPERFEPKAGRYETRFGYLDSAPMRHGFIALYSGRTRGAFPGRANYASTLHVFGARGRLRAAPELDADVISIAWSEEDRLLYAISHDPVPAVLVYELPDR